MTALRSVAIVGGGPSGATCARRLAQAGAGVTLFEARPSSEKPCGGGVPAAALDEFPELASPDLPRRVVHHVVIHSPAGRSVPVPLDDGRHAREGIHIFRRVELDSFLRAQAAAAGAVVIRAKVSAVRQGSDGGWELETSEGPAGPFEHLIGADGVHSVVRRSLTSAPRLDRDLTLALYAYLPGVPRGEMVLKFFAEMDGYFWIFPRADHLSVGICATRSSRSAGDLEAALRTFVEQHCPGITMTNVPLKGYFIPARKEITIGPDGSWALVGDAGGQVDPITREGIAWAMRSGLEAARNLLRTGQAATPTLPSNLAWAHRYGAGFYRKEFLESMALLSRGSASIRSVLADLLSGHQGYKRLRRRLLLKALPCGAQMFLTVLRAGIP